MAFTEPGSPKPEKAPSARRIASDASRRKLLDAAAAVFAGTGYSAAKAADIAAKAGVAVGTLYLHFGDKEGIARAVALDALEGLRAKLRRAAMRPGLTPEAAARAHAAALVGFVTSAEAQSHLLFATESPGLRSEVFAAMAEAQEAHLRERGEEGFFRTDVNATVAAQALVGMQSRVLMWWIEDRKRASRAAIVDTLAKLRLSGIHAHAPARKPASKPKNKPARKPSSKPRKKTASAANTSRGARDSRGGRGAQDSRGKRGAPASRTRQKAPSSRRKKP